MTMTSLPIPVLSDHVAPGPAGLPLYQIGNPGLADEQFLRRAFRSFSEAAATLEASYASLRSEVERLRRELEASKALAEMSATLAHEIRNPLGSLELFAGLLQDSELDAECRQWVERIQAGLRTLSATVNNVLHFYCVSEPARAPVDLGSLLDWAHAFFMPLARQDHIVLSLQNRLQGVVLQADRHCLEQVLLNLVLNSARAAGEGGWIELRGHEISTEDGGGVALSVADNGPGISAEDLPRIFDAGFSTHAGGSGLGLAVCRRIVEQHGGTISAASDCDTGTTFTLRFPLRVEVPYEVPLESCSCSR
jgi:signal transduction histidine kinase